VTGAAAFARGCGRRALARAAIALAALGLAAGAARSARAETTTASAASPAVTRVSNLHSATSWAYPMSEALIRSSPSPRAHAVGRLRFLTIDQQAELYVVLASAKLASGARWLQIEVPARPNGRLGWVPEEALGPLQVVHSYLLIDQSTLTATLFREGRAIFHAPIGVGKASTVTPAGHFYVLEKIESLDDPFYGPFALGTSAYAPTLSEWPGGGVVGIHGTNEPQLIPGRPSHGCVRMRDSDIERLWSLIELGTPIEIT
jgi:hypothetical protein